MSWIVARRFQRSVNRAIPAGVTVYLAIGIIYVVVLSGVFIHPLNPRLSPASAILLAGFWPFILSLGNALPLIAAGVIAGCLLYNALSHYTRLPRPPAVINRIATWARSTRGEKVLGAFILAEPLSRVTTGLAIVGARTLMYPDQYQIREFHSHAAETIDAISDNLPHIIVFTDRVVNPTALPSKSTIFEAWADGLIRSSDIGVFVGYPVAVLLGYLVLTGAERCLRR